MITAKEVLEQLETTETENTPDLKQQQCELLAFLKDALNRVQIGKQSLDAFHVREGVKCMLTTEAERMHKEIEELVKSMFWSEAR